MELTREQLYNLIEDAVTKLSHSECPHCQCYIGMDLYLTSEEVKKEVDSLLEISRISMKGK